MVACFFNSQKKKTQSIDWFSCGVLAVEVNAIASANEGNLARAR